MLKPIDSDEYACGSRRTGCVVQWYRPYGEYLCQTFFGLAVRILAANIQLAAYRDSL